MSVNALLNAKYYVNPPLLVGSRFQKSGAATEKARIRITIRLSNGSSDVILMMVMIWDRHHIEELW